MWRHICARGGGIAEDRSPLGGLAGGPANLLVGYRQRTQFDIDRWILGLLQAEVGVRIVEVPTIPGLAASLAGGFIDEGMRSGIPDGDWGIVVTVYGSDAEPIVEMTGNEGGQTARVLLLDGEGNVVWFWDDGYSARLALEVQAAVEDRRAEAATGGDDPVE